MKLKCNNCGEIVESGLESTMNHVFSECTNYKTEVLSDMFSAIYRPFANFTPLEELGEEKINLQLSK